MLTEICKEINNWFTHDEDKYVGTYSIAGGVIVNPPFTLEKGRYYRIIGSVFNDGVYRYDDAPEAEEGLIDEGPFDGAIWLMSVPKDFISLVHDIEQWNDINGAIDSANMSPFTSESFDMYSYSKGGGGTGSGDATVSWQAQFGKSLNRYRKVGI